MFIRMSDSPLTRFMQFFYVGIAFPALIAIAWWKAAQFDPYTMIFFTKTFIEPTPGMPSEFRIFGWVVIGIGGLLLWACVKGIRKKVHTLRETTVVLLMGLEIIAFGGAFFVAANSAEERINERMASEAT